MLTVASAALGVLLMPDAYQKLHFVTPAVLVAPVPVALAALVQTGLDENTGETWLAVAFLVVAGPYLLHATVRALRIREHGDWKIGRTMTVLASVHTPYTVATGMMDALQVCLLVLVAIAMATAVVLIRVPVRQVLAVSVYGLLLAVLFLAFQAPDVTLSELTVGAVVLPAVLLLTLAKVRKREE